MIRKWGVFYAKSGGNNRGKGFIGVGLGYHSGIPEQTSYCNNLFGFVFLEYVAYVISFFFIFQLVRVFHMKNKQFHANLSTVLLAVLRERIEFLPHQGLVLEATSLSKKSLDKILSGEQDITIHQLLNIIYKFGLFDELQVSHKLYMELGAHNFYFQNGNLSKEEDNLLELYNNYFKHKDFIIKLISQNNYRYSYIGQLGSTFTRYCLDEEFRKFFNEENPSISSIYF